MTLSGAFARDDGAALPGSTTVFFYIEIAGQPDDFVRGQEALDPATGGFSSVVTDIPAGSSRLFLSFVVTDPAEALDAGESGADTVFALQVSNFVCAPQLTITLEWFDAISDVDLYVTEPGGTEVYFFNPAGVSAEDNPCTYGRLFYCWLEMSPAMMAYTFFERSRGAARCCTICDTTSPIPQTTTRRLILQDVGTLDNDDTSGFGPENYVVSSGLDTGVSPVLGDYVAHVELFRGSDVSWRLTARVLGDVVWIEEGDFAPPFNIYRSADFTVSLTEYAPGC